MHADLDVYGIDMGFDDVKKPMKILINSIKD